MSLAYEQLSARILEACFEVSNELGAGFLEAVYLNALVIALQQKGLSTECETSFQVTFRGHAVGAYQADLVVNQVVLVELKAIQSLLPEHKAQVIHYLKASGLEVGLLVNFGRPRIEYFRLENPNLASGLPKLSPKQT